MVAHETVLAMDPDTAWELITDPEVRREWLGEEWEDREAFVEEAQPGRHVSWWWDDGLHGSRVEVVLSPAVGGTRVTVVETPVAAPMALAAA